ncbi:MAG: hypothetical protein JRJ86_02615 [Deltaproteobacteria bacterium]|nr:hypothetical protein [Deltaproteobacteria bacterium]MBW2116656.1 hypothetical protein [Deltaproteobacteria bacterium]MBW2343235.1 hypothetical protein [Deltaproteobacteria bacterium]
MPDIFKIIELHEKRENNKRGVCIGIDVRIANREVSCPVSGVCYSEGELAIEAKRIQEDLNRIAYTCKGLFGVDLPDKGLRITPEMAPEEIWSILSEIAEDDLFVETYNGLDPTRRTEVAEHVLSNCNIFSGKAAVFSARYDNKTGLME